MLFFVDEENEKLVSIDEQWKLPELKLEKYILSSQDGEITTLNSSVFSEELLLLKNQVQTKNKKRADIIALDKYGSVIIIELKRDYGALGVDMQALQYLSYFSRFSGSHFLTEIGVNIEEGAIESFLEDGVSISDINKTSRIILVARGFDPALYSMGEWLVSKGIAFRCVSYRPVKVGENKYLSFSISFDRSPASLYPVKFYPKERAKKYYWFNIGIAEDYFWSFMKTNGVITAGFDGEPGDAGERLLRSFVAGDTLIAYATGKGAVGFGVIKKASSETYKLIEPDTKEDIADGDHLHRANIEWLYVAPSLSDAIPAKEVGDKFHIYHPIGTSCAINNSENAEKLISEMKIRFVRNAQL